MLDGISALAGYTGGDKTPSFVNNFAAAIAARVPFHIPAGDHVISQALAYQGPNPVTIIGDGKNNSRIIWDANASSEGISIRSTNDKGGATLRDFSLISRKASVSTCINLNFVDQAVPINGNDTLIVDRFKPRAQVDNVIMSGDDNVDAYGWANGIFCSMPLQVRITDCTFIGQRNGANDYRSETAFYLGTPTNLGHPVESYVDRCAVYFTKRGVRFEGMEGMFARGNHIVDCDVGFEFFDPTGRPHVECVGNHMNINTNGINCSGVREARINGNSIYHRVNTPKAGVAIGVGGPNASHFTITENFIINNIDTQASLSAIDIYNCDHGRIDGNQIVSSVPGRGAQGKGITLGGGARFIIVGRDNVFPHPSSGRQQLIHNVADFGQQNTIRT